MSGARNGLNRLSKQEPTQNKVLQPDRKMRSNDESVNSNPSSLAGQISVKDMGSRVSKDSPSKSSSESSSRSKSQSTKPSSYNYSYSGTFEDISYQPTNPQTSHVFELIMSEAYHFLPDVSNSVILSAADLLLEILKLEEKSITSKRKEINELLGASLDDLQFNELVSLSKQITDYNVKEDIEQDEDEAGDGVAVLFDDVDNEDNLGQGLVDSSEEEEEEEEATDTPNIQSNLDNDRPAEDSLGNEETIIDSKGKQTSKSNVVPFDEIDPLFLHRKLSSILLDAELSTISDKSNAFFRYLLDHNLPTRDLENELMELMEYDHFEFVKLCIENRWRIVFKIKLTADQSEESINKVFDEIKDLGLEELSNELSDSIFPNERKRKLAPDEEEEESTKKPKAKGERVPKIVDLDNLSFDQGSHLMSNTKVKLPQGSYQQNKKLYDIISVPPPPPPPSLEEADEKLVSILELPEWARDAFPFSETATLNRIQSKIYPEAFNSDENLLLCAPTGAGKTNVAMLSVLRTIHNHRDPESGHINLKNFKIVYIAPLKALVQEQMREFQRRLTANYGIVVNELTGDSSLNNAEIAETQMLITTPEKWDVITRKINETSFTNLVRLIIIDEIHLLHDERGPVLESIVSRTIRQTETSGQPVRLVGLSATLPNYEDVASFLRVDFKRGLFYFDSSYRPCPLQQQFIGIKEKKAIKKINAMNEACYDKLLECAQNKHQLIIFVHSRKDTFKTAKWLKDKLIEEGKQQLILKSDAGSSEILKQESQDMDNKGLKEIIPEGFGIHHAGLNRKERSVVEDLFAQGHVQVLISTATLAWGVNLPAHTVIIKGTETYSPEKGSWVQLSPQDILQMLGRAGRPRYDKSGEGVIITSQDEIQYYLAVLNQQLPIESQLMSKIVDNLNAEIVLGSVKSRDDAVRWLGYTYLYIRMLKSPALYHVGAEYENDDSLFWKRMDLVHSALTILDSNKLVTYDPGDGHLKSTELGRIASYYYINYPTINMYNTQLKPWMSEIDILRVFSSSGEFKFIPVRQEEKLEVSKLLEKCPFPVKENPNEPLAKVNLLLQAYISRLTLEGFALMADMIYITQSAGRLLRAIHEIVLRKNWSSLAKTTLNLCIMTERRMWLTNSPFRQFETKVPKEVIKATESSHLPWVSYFNLNAAELAEAINFKGHSQTAYELLQYFPKVSLSYYSQPITPTIIRVQLAIIPEWIWNSDYHRRLELFLLLVEDCDGDKILYSESIFISKVHSERELLVEFTVPISEPIQPNYYITLISERWLHSETRIPLLLYDTKFPKKFPAFTELFDLQRKSTSALKLPEFINFFNFEYFNKAQTQVFDILYGSNENIFVGLAKGNGKTVCSELAILNHWRQNKGRIVYIQPCQRIIDKLYKIWNKKFAFVSEDKVINKLTGDRTEDFSLVSSSHLILSTPEQFEALSRRWRQRKAIRSIELIIADDSHIIGNGIQGAAYEALLTRMRFISDQAQMELRIIALSSPLSSARDFGEWIGCEKLNIFNFNPSYRVSPIEEIRLQSFKSSSVSTIALQALPSSYEFVKSNHLTGNSILYVASRKECFDIAWRFLMKSSNDEWNLLEVEVEDIQPYLNKLLDPKVKELVSAGIGVYYDSMSDIDKLIIEKLFNSNILKILISSKETAFYLPVTSHVAVLGTQAYEGKEARYLDYSVNQILEMVGNCQNENGKGKVLISTNTSKQSHYSKFLNDALPIESGMNTFIHEPFINEISNGTFRSRQDCVDWITYTYFYRRLQQNPSYYDAKDTSHLGLSEYLSELVEDTLKELASANMIELEIDDDDNEAYEDEDDVEEISPLNPCIISSYYDVSFITMKEFNKLENKTKLKGIMEILTSASELDVIPIRPDEESQLSKIYSKVPVKATSIDYYSPYFKAFVLLQAHFSRITLPHDLANDQKLLLKIILSLLGACIDTLSNEGYLNAINAMDLSQMIVQGVWTRDSPLKQIPFVTEEMLARARKYKVENIYDVMSLEDDERDDLLQLQGEKLNKVAEFVNKYPNIDLSYELDLSDSVRSNEPKEISIILERDEDMDDLEVVSAQYPYPKTEGWWIVIGDSASRQLYAIKKTQISKESQNVRMEFTVPTTGHHKLSIWCMCDSYVDADKEIEFEIDVKQGDTEN